MSKTVNASFIFNKDEFYPKLIAAVHSVTQKVPFFTYSFEIAEENHEFGVVNLVLVAHDVFGANFSHGTVQFKYFENNGTTNCTATIDVSMITGAGLPICLKIQSMVEKIYQLVNSY